MDDICTPYHGGETLILEGETTYYGVESTCQGGQSLTKWPMSKFRGGERYYLHRRTAGWPTADSEATSYGFNFSVIIM